MDKSILFAPSTEQAFTALLGTDWASRPCWYGVSYFPDREGRKYEFLQKSWQEHLTTLADVVDNPGNYYRPCSYTDKAGNARKSAFCLLLRAPDVLCIDVDTDQHAAQVRALLEQEGANCAYDKSARGAHFFFKYRGAGSDYVVRGNNHCLIRLDRNAQTVNFVVDYCPGTKNGTAIGWNKVADWQGLELLIQGQEVGEAPAWLLSGVPERETVAKGTAGGGEPAPCQQEKRKPGRPVRINLPEVIPAGARNETLHLTGIEYCKKRKGGVQQVELQHFLLQVNQNYCRPALEPAEVATIANSCADSEANQKERYNRAGVLGGVVGNIVEGSRWGWAAKGKVWRENEGEITEVTTELIAREGLKAGADVLKSGEVEQVKNGLRGRWARADYPATPTGALLVLGEQGRRVITNRGESYSLDNWFLCGGGAFNGAALFAPISVPADVVDSFAVADVWAQGADDWLRDNAPVWHYFFNSAVLPNCRRALLECIANFLIPSVSGFHRGIWLLYGKQQSGKSTFTSALSGVLSNRAQMIATYKPDREGRFALSGLIGGASRLLAPEINYIHCANSTDLKSLGAGEPVLAEAKKVNSVEVRQKVTCLFGTNKLPTFEDPALRDRFCVLGFVPVPKEQQDAKLTEKLIQDFAGVGSLALAVLALELRREVRFSHPQFDLLKCADDSDILAQFCREEVAYLPGAQVSNEQLGQAFRAFCGKFGAEGELEYYLSPRGGGFDIHRFRKPLKAILEGLGGTPVAHIKQGRARGWNDIDLPHFCARPEGEMPGVND